MGRAAPPISYLTSKVYTARLTIQTFFQTEKLYNANLYPRAPALVAPRRYL